MRRILYIVALTMTSPLWARSGHALSAHHATRTIVTVYSARGRHQFRVELAVTPEQQARGLMYRTRIPAGTGMLFPMNPPLTASFWMKNCPVPEDMIFIRADGTIARIAAMTVPYSTYPISSGEPIVAVLEVAGGETAKRGIAEGDHVSWTKS